VSHHPETGGFSVNDRIAALSKEVKGSPEQIYGEGLKGVYLYGSYARGEEDSESDTDLVVVLDQPDYNAAEVDRTGYLISELSLKHGVSVSRVFVSLHDWSDREAPFLLNAREEAIPV
jgi:predicted nucleotidyltransferase